MLKPTPPSPAPRWLVWAGLVLLAGYAVFLARHTTVAAGGADSSGYLNSARILAAGRLETTLRIPAELGAPATLRRLDFNPQGFLAYAGNPNLSPTYPTGLPLHLAVAGKLFGWTAGPMIVSLAGALGAVALCYALGRELQLEPMLAATAAVVLGVFPVLLFTSTQPLSDTLATTWALAAAYTALRARRHRGWALATGLAVALAVLVRPTNIVILPGIVLLLGFDMKRLAIAGLAGLPGAAWLLNYNRIVYGGPFASGYGDWKSAFSTVYGWPTLGHFSYWLAVFLPTLLLPLALYAPASRVTPRRDVIALALLFAAPASVYLFYSVSHEVWWCLRFILPAIPALILLGMLGLQAALQRRAARRPTAHYALVAAAVCGWALIASTHWSKRQGVFLIKGYEQVYAEICAAARAQLPPGSLVISHYTSGAIYFYTDFSVLRWDQIEAPKFGEYARRALAAGRTVGAVIFDVEDVSALQERCPGTWEKIATVKNAAVWRLVTPAAAPAKA